MMTWVKYDIYAFLIFTPLEFIEACADSLEAVQILGLCKLIKACAN